MGLLRLNTVEASPPIAGIAYAGNPQCSWQVNDPANSRQFMSGEHSPHPETKLPAPLWQTNRPSSLMAQKYAPFASKPHCPAIAGSQSRQMPPMHSALAQSSRVAQFGGRQRPPLHEPPGQSAPFWPWIAVSSAHAVRSAVRAP
jgi:hypothetical protein